VRAVVRRTRSFWTLNPHPLFLCPFPLTFLPTFTSSPSFYHFFSTPTSTFSPCGSRFRRGSGVARCRKEMRAFELSLFVFRDPLSTPSSLLQLILFTKSLGQVNVNDSLETPPPLGALSDFCHPHTSVSPFYTELSGKVAWSVLTPPRLWTFERNVPSSYPPPPPSIRMA